MAFRSIDQIQNILADSVFNYTRDSKKASGRTLGTLVEIITYYLIKTWGLNNHISIERGLEEYGNSDITHNVEFSLHPVVKHSILKIPQPDKSITSNFILKCLKDIKYDLSLFKSKSNNLLNNDVIRNACTIATSEKSCLLCSIESLGNNNLELNIYEQSKKPYSMVECKRVGVEEGKSKGPQTIEKAKQGAYVAKTTSSLQKVRNDAGELNGIIYKSDSSFILKPYLELIDEVIFSNDVELLRKFILSVGVVSNHGNWFSSENQNKELKVLAQAYDWLLFLTDEGLSEFIETLLLQPNPKYKPIMEAFLSSYNPAKTKNQFTKVQMNIHADKLLSDYFSENITNINNWFNVISPSNKGIDILIRELNELANKNWVEILS